MFKYGYMLINSFVFGASGGSYLVDDYSPDVAFSVRKISSTATNCIRVRRSSDSAEQDIGFSGDDLDTASLESFCSSTDGFVVRWYNQANANENLYSAFMSTASVQPQIVSSGSTLTEGGKPAILFPNGDRLELNTDASSPWTTAGNTASVIDDVFAVAKINNYTALNYIVGGLGLTTGLFMGGTFGGVNGLGGYDQTNIRSDSGESTTRKLAYWHNDGSNLEVSEDGATVTDVGSFTFTTMRYVGFRQSNSFDGDIQEIIMFSSDELSNKSDIESDMNTYYSIY